MLYSVELVLAGSDDVGALLVTVSGFGDQVSFADFQKKWKIVRGFFRDVDFDAIFIIRCLDKERADISLVLRTENID